MSGKAMAATIAALAFGCLIAIGVLFATGAQAQEQCPTRAEIAKDLTEKYSESPKAIGMVNEQSIMELWTSDRGTWTILATTADGHSCPIAAGNNFEFDTTAFDKAKKGKAL